MADLIELDLVVRDKGLKASVSTVERLERQIIKAQKAVDQNTISQARYNKILLAAKRDYQALGVSSQRATAQVRAFAAANKTAQVATAAQTTTLNSATVATNKLSAAQAQTKNKMNGNNMAIQQLGYQFGDFAVQVQGGTSAFVAFSQQGSQLAGILPMIAGPLGISMGLAVGLSAALGILIPIIGAVGRLFMEAGGSGKSLNETVDGLSSSFDDYITAASGANSSTEDLLKTYGRITPEILELEERLQALQLRQVALDAQATAKAISSWDFGGALLGGELDDIRVTFDTTVDRARMLQRAIVAVGKAKGPEETLAAIQALSAQATDAAGGVDNLTAKQIDFLQQVTASEQEFQRLVNILGVVKVAQDDVNSNNESSLEYQRDMHEKIADAQADSLDKTIEGYVAAKDIQATLEKENELLRLKKKFGEDSLQVKEQEKANALEAFEAEVRLLTKNEAIVSTLVKQKSLQLSITGEIEDSTAATKEQEAATKAVAKAMKSLSDFGGSIEKKLVMATAELEALKNGGDSANASMAAGLEYELSIRHQIAMSTAAQAGNMDAMAASQMRYNKALKDLAKLSGVQAEIAANKPTTSSSRGGQTNDEYLAQLLKEIEQKQELVGLSKEEVKVKTLLNKIEDKGISLTDDRVKELVKEQKELDKSVKISKDYQAMISDIRTGLTDALNSVIDGTKSVGNAFKDMMRQMLRSLAQKSFIQPLVGAITGGATASMATQAAASGSGAILGASGSIAAGASALGSGLYAGAGTALGFGTSASVVGSTAAATGAMGSFGMALGAVAGPLLAVVAIISFFKKKVKELDSGLQGTVTTLDVTIESFSKIQTKRFFGLSKKVSTSGTELSDEAAEPFVKAIQDIQMSVLNAAESLNISKDVFDNFSYDFKLSLKGLSEEAASAAIAEEFIKMGDAFAYLSGHFETMNELLAVAQQRYDLETRKLQVLGDTQALLARQREIELASVHDLNRELLLEIHALEDLAMAVDGTTGILGDATEAFNLQARALQAMGDAEGLLALRRQNELENVNELNKELLLEVHALEDLAMAVESTTSEAEKMTSALEDASSAVEDAASELQYLLDESLDAALGGLERAIDARKDAIYQKFDSLISGLQDRLSAADNTARASSEIYSILSGALEGRSLAGASFAGREAARAYVSGGGTDAERLQSAVNTLSEPSAQLFSSFEDYARDFALTSNVLKDSKDAAEAQMTADEQAVVLLEKQIEQADKDRNDQLRVLDEQLEAAQLQVDTLKGIDTSVLSVDAAMQTVRDAMTTYEQTQANHSELNSSVLTIQQAINNLAGAVQAQAAAQAAAAAASQAQAAAQAQVAAAQEKLAIAQSGAQTDVNSTAANISMSQARAISDATPMSAAEQSMLSRYSGGERPDHIKLAIAQGKKYDPSVGGYRHFASGGVHTGGLRMVGETGPELEVTGPSRIYSASQTKGMMSNPELVAEIKELRREISDTKTEQRAASIAMVKYNKRTSDQLRTWNSVGLPQERTN